MPERAVERENPPKIHRVRVMLCHIEPTIWRVIETPTDISLEELHRAIQSAMGWGQAHLYAFKRAGTTYTDTSFGAPRPDEVDAADVTLGEVLGEGGRHLSYVYDFGDSWRHDIWLEEPVEPVQGRRYPRLVAGERACPPEDCGGVPGYRRLLEVIDGEVDDPHLREWVPEDFDPEQFDAAPRAVAGARTYWWDESASSNESDSAESTVLAVFEEFRRRIDRDDAYDEELAERLTDELDRSADNFERMAWAFNEVFEARDGVSPRVRQLLEEMAAMEVGLGDRLVSILSDQQLLEMGSAAPINAADVLGELRYEPAVVPLIDAFAYVEDVEEPLAKVAIAALIEIGEAAIDPLIDAYDEVESRRERQLILAVLAYMRVDDERIEQRLVDSLDELSKDYPEPALFASIYGGERLQGELEERFEQVADDVLSPERRKAAQRTSIEAKRLRKRVEYALLLFEKLEDAGHAPTERQHSLADQLEDLHMSLTSPRDFLRGTSEPYRARETPGRNDPCWCGSGKKYKKCHLRKDQS